MQEDIHYAIKCAYCGIVLVGRGQFMGHMIHSHELDYSQLEQLWSKMMTDMAAMMTATHANTEYSKITIQSTTRKSQGDEKLVA
jgi:hypothetical protein